MSLQQQHDHAAGRLTVIARWGDWLRLATFIAVVAVVLLGAALFVRQSNEHSIIARQACIARVNGSFSGHLADALGQEPASLRRSEFTDLMKRDADQFRHIDTICPG